LWNWFWGL